MSVFTEIEASKILLRSSHFFLVRDNFPVSPGHILIISNDEGIVDYFGLNEIQKSELFSLIDQAKTLIEKSFSPDGYNIGMNCGLAAGQTVMHFHCHVIPRYTGDVTNPRGGIRHCIPSKGNY